MYKIKITLFLFVFAFIFINAQTGKMYQFYDHKEKARSFDEVAKSLEDYDVILFGEYHNNSTNHWLQLQLLKFLYKKKGQNLILGAEMFERDNQDVLNDYLANKISEKQLKENARLWSNYFTDYKPLVDFSKENNLSFIATNIPRRYASTLAKNGFEALDSLKINEKKWMVNLPFEIDYTAPGYPEMLEMMKDHSELKAKQFVAAQAIKDATMAESIHNALKLNSTFLHFNGDYHSKNYGGIYWYLKKMNPNLKIAVIQIIESNDELLKVEKLKNKNLKLTEFTLVLPLDTIKTY